MDSGERILRFLRSYTEKHRRPPTVREIQRAVGFKSPRSVSYFLDKLEKARRIVRRGRSRGIFLADAEAEPARHVVEPALFVPKMPFQDVTAFAMVSRDKCFNCGLIGECQSHHVVPRVMGGIATVSLCLDCHARVHNRTAMTGSALTSLGMRIAKARGVRFGRETVVTEAQRVLAKEILQLNPDTSVTRLSKQLKLSLGTASRLKRIVAQEVHHD